MFDQDHDRNRMGLNARSGTPGALRNPANADLTRIHEVRRAFDVLRAPHEIVRQRRTRRCNIAVDIFCDDRAIMHYGLGKQSIAPLRDRRRNRRARRLKRRHCRAARQRLERKWTEVKRPVF